MKFRGGKSRLILTGVLIILSAVVASAADDWISVKSENFDLVGNAKEKDVRDVATRLEQFRVVFGKVFSGLKLNSPIPTTVVVFKDEESFAPYRSNKWTAGYFLSSEDKNYIVLPVGNDREETYSTIFHEYIHFLIINNFGRERIAPWFNEGIAEYYDKFQTRDDQTFTVGGVSKRHLATLRENPLIPFKTFFGIDYASLQKQGDHGASVFYAQSWAFIHFLIRGSNGKRAAQFNKFMNLTLNGEQSGSAFQKAFQTDYSILETELRLYLAKPEQMTHSILRLDKKLQFDGDLKTSKVSRADSMAYLGDLIYRNGDRVRAETTLKAALALNGNSGLANATLGLIRIHQDKLTEAQVFFERAVKSNPNDYSVYYYYAYALGRKSGYSADTARRIRESVLKSIALNPDFAPNYDLMANVSLDTDSNYDEGIDYAKRGVALAPGDQGFALNLANLYIRKEDVENASRLVSRILSNPATPGIKSYAFKLTAIIMQLRKKLGDSGGYAVAETSGPPVKLTRTQGIPQGMTEEEYARRKREVEVKGINSALKRLKPNEKHLLGHLTQIKCTGKDFSYLVKSAAGDLVLYSKGIKSIVFDTYNVDLKDLQLGCNLIKKPVFGVVTYRPLEGKPGIIGEMVRIEFVPEYFRFIGK